MLVLSRQRDEVICIGGNVTITVMDIRGDKVRIGIIAPSYIAVDRKEVRDSKDADASLDSISTAPYQAMAAKLWAETDVPYDARLCQLFADKLKEVSML